MEELTAIAYTKLTLDKSYTASIKQDDKYSFTSIILFMPIEYSKEGILEDLDLTQHAMRLSSTALHEDWENEEDAYWESFLDR